MKFCIKRFYCCNGLKEQLSYTKSTYLLHVHTPPQRHSKKRILRFKPFDWATSIQNHLTFYLSSILPLAPPSSPLRSYLNSCKVRSNVRTRGAVDFSTKRSSRAKYREPVEGDLSSTPRPTPTIASPSPRRRIEDSFKPFRGRASHGLRVKVLPVQVAHFYVPPLLLLFLLHPSRLDGFFAWKREKRKTLEIPRVVRVLKKKKRKKTNEFEKKERRKNIKREYHFFFFALERMKLEYALKYPGKSGGKNSLRENELLDYHRGKGGDGKNLSQWLV